MNHASLILGIHGTPYAHGERVEIATNRQILPRGFADIIARLGVPPKQRSLVVRWLSVASGGFRS